jgi:hypothetical protein
LLGRRLLPEVKVQQLFVCALQVLIEIWVLRAQGLQLILKEKQAGGAKLRHACKLVNLLSKKGLEGMYASQNI